MSFYPAHDEVQLPMARSEDPTLSNSCFASDQGLKKCSGGSPTLVATLAWIMSSNRGTALRWLAVRGAPTDCCQLIACGGPTRRRAVSGRAQRTTTYQKSCRPPLVI